MVGVGLHVTGSIMHKAYPCMGGAYVWGGAYPRWDSLKGAWSLALSNLNMSVGLSACLWTEGGNQSFWMTTHNTGRNFT